MSRNQQPPPRRTAAVKTQIDENLRRVYQDAVDQGVPDRFGKLLEALRQQAAAPTTDATRAAAQDDDDPA